MLLLYSSGLNEILECFVLVFVSDLILHEGLFKSHAGAQVRTFAFVTDALQFQACFLVFHRNQKNVQAAFLVSLQHVASA
jgi:hypothetical protein